MQTYDAVHLSMNEFSDRLVTIAPGEAFVYFQGDLTYTRHKARDKEHINAGELSGMADLAWNAYLDGKAFLTQRRRGHKCFDYIATKKAR